MFSKKFFPLRSIYKRKKIFFLEIGFHHPKVRFDPLALSEEAPLQKIKIKFPFRLFLYAFFLSIFFHAVCLLFLFLKSQRVVFQDSLPFVPVTGQIQVKKPSILEPKPQISPPLEKERKPKEVPQKKIKNTKKTKKREQKSNQVEKKQEQKKKNLETGHRKKTEEAVFSENWFYEVPQMEQPLPTLLQAYSQNIQDLINEKWEHLPFLKEENASCQVRFSLSPKGEIIETSFRILKQEGSQEFVNLIQDLIFSMNPFPPNQLNQVLEFDILFSSETSEVQEFR